MGTENISLDEEAYRRLDSRRRDGEDFSDVVKRLADENSWGEITDVLTDEEAEKMRRTIEDGRGVSRRRADRIAERIERRE